MWMKQDEFKNLPPTAKNEVRNSEYALQISYHMLTLLGIQLAKLTNVFTFRIKIKSGNQPFKI